MTISDAVIATVRAMRDTGLTTATVGNVSARLGPRSMIITPTRRHPDDLRPDELIEMDFDADLAGDATPSLEWLVHAAVYRVRPDVRAIVHTHSPFAIARSFSPAPIIVESEERVYLGIDQLDVAPPAPAGSPDLAAAAVTALGSRAAALLGRHGVLAVGATPREAFDVARTVEHLAIVDLFRARATTAPLAQQQPPPGPCGDTPRQALADLRRSQHRRTRPT